MRRILPLLLILSFILISCGDQVKNGIFYMIANEEKIVDNSLSNEITVTNIFESNGYYFAVSKYLWYKAEGSGGDWKKLSMPSGYSDHGVVTSSVADGTNIYVSVTDRRDGDSAIYPLAVTAGNLANSTWGAVIHTNNGTSSDYKAYYLFDTGANYFVNEISYNGDGESTGSLLYTGGSAAVAATLGTASPLPNATNSGIKSICNNGGTYYAIYNSEGSNYNHGVILRGGATTLAVHDDGLSAANFNSIYALGGTVYLATAESGDDHHIYYTANDGTSWASIDTDGSSQIKSFCDISTIQANTILLGSTYYYNGSNNSGSNLGYYELDTSGPTISTNSFSNNDNYLSTSGNDVSLRGATITCMYYDSTGSGFILAGTYGNGLWMNTLNAGDGERYWSIE